jgi:hypothetical protein
LAGASHGRSGRSLVLVGIVHAAAAVVVEAVLQVLRPLDGVSVAPVRSELGVYALFALRRTDGVPEELAAQAAPFFAHGDSPCVRGLDCDFFIIRLPQSQTKEYITNIPFCQWYI